MMRHSSATTFHLDSGTDSRPNPQSSTSFCSLVTGPNPNPCTIKPVPAEHKRDQKKKQKFITFKTCQNHIVTYSNQLSFFFHYYHVFQITYNHNQFVEHESYTPINHHNKTEHTTDEPVPNPFRTSQLYHETSPFEPVSRVTKAKHQSRSVQRYIFIYA